MFSKVSYDEIEAPEIMIMTVGEVQMTGGKSSIKKASKLCTVGECKVRRSRVGF